jgi:hypothetical protein
LGLIFGALITSTSYGRMRWTTRCLSCIKGCTYRPPGPERPRLWSNQFPVVSIGHLWKVVVNCGLHHAVIIWVRNYSLGKSSN